MAAENTTTAAAVLKRRYVGKLQVYCFVVSPTLGMLPKDTSPGFVGSAIHWPIRYGGTGGRSALFATALANETGTSSDQWAAPVAEDFSLASITGKLIDVTRNDEGAFIRGLTNVLDAARKQIVQSISQKIWRNGGGAVGKIQAIAGNVVTLTQISDSHNFSLNMKYDTDNTDGASGGAADGNPQLLTKIDEDTGELTFGAVAGFAVGEWLFPDGDFGIAMKGIPAIIPVTAPGVGATPDALYGVTRSTYAQALAGIRYPTAAGDGDLEQLGINVAARLNRSRTDYPTGELMWCMHDNDLAQLINLMGAKAQYDRLSPRGNTTKADVGYDGVRFLGPNGRRAYAISDPFIPETDSWMITPKSFRLYSAGEVPKVMDYGTGQLPQLLPTTDEIRIRFGYRAVLGCEMPGANAYVNLTPLVV
jgi:hypothetical protein